MRQRSNRMMAVRDSNSMKWHFKEFRDPKCRLLGATRNDQLVGYAVILRRDNKALELSRAKLADMVVVNDEPRIVTGLFKMAVKCATDDGAAMLEVEGLPNSIREPLRGLSPFTIAHQKCPFWFGHRKNQHSIVFPAWTLGTRDSTTAMAVCERPSNVSLQVQQE